MTDLPSAKPPRKNVCCSAGMENESQGEPRILIALTGSLLWQRASGSTELLNDLRLLKETILELEFYCTHTHRLEKALKLMLVTMQLVERKMMVLFIGLEKMEMKMFL